MSNDFETTISFEKYEGIFWKKLNSSINLSNLGTGYKLRFFCGTPSVNNMTDCINEDTGVLITDKTEQEAVGLYSADEGFASVTFGLKSNFPDEGGFEIVLNSNSVVNIDAYEGVIGYYRDGRFYDTIEETVPMPYYANHIHIDKTDLDNLEYYTCDGSSYTKTTKPRWMDIDGHIIVKGIFLVNSSDYVIAYCRYSTPLLVREAISLPVGSKFVQIGGCSQ